MFINLYMFRATKCPSSGETTVFLCLCDTWYLLFCANDCLVCSVQVHTAYQTRITSTKCRINTVVFPDDGHIVARNM